MKTEATRTHANTVYEKHSMQRIASSVCSSTIGFFSQVESLFPPLDPATAGDTDLSPTPAHRNLNIPANHRVQSSNVIAADLLVSLKETVTAGFPAGRPSQSTFLSEQGYKTNNSTGLNPNLRFWRRVYANKRLCKDRKQHQPLLPLKL